MKKKTYEPTEVYKAVDVAKDLISRLHSKGEHVDQWKVQKLLYYAQMWHLYFFEQPIFEDALKAYKYGPVAPNVRERFKKNKDKPIEEKFKGKIDSLFLDYIVNYYGGILSKKLVDMTHEENPWDDAWKAKKAGGSDEMSLHSMLEYADDGFKKSSKASEEIHLKFSVAWSVHDLNISGRIKLDNKDGTTKEVVIDAI
jgi:uncharacterized phage-associated protein